MSELAVVDKGADWRELSRLQGSNPADAMTNVAARTVRLLLFVGFRETFGASRGWERVAWQTLKCRHAPTLTRPSQYGGFQQE